MSQFSKIALSGLLASGIGNALWADDSAKGTQKCASKSGCKGMASDTLDLKASCKSSHKCKGQKLDSLALKKAKAGCNGKMGCQALSSSAGKDAK